MFNKICIKAKIAADNFVNDHRGVTAIEYAVIGVAVSAIVLVVFTSDTGLKKALADAVKTVSTNISSANIKS
ncbi:Flp family type IVb pilin [Vibrio kasasachensis]|uniref:Flp family type IVb pilin n=1 Tax=Vibrio kasasachensis TaxID=2910248 RepID=UPI003D0B1FCE